jgi:hypothetical protein
MTSTIRIGTQWTTGASQSAQMATVLADLHTMGSWESMAVRAVARSQPHRSYTADRAVTPTPLRAA